MKKQTVIFASTNQGKFDEFKRLIQLSPDEFTVLCLKDLPYAIPECEETGETFEDNARLKVEHTRKYLESRHAEAIIVGDDSGMGIAALSGAPGVHTRRWNGSRMTDKEIIAHCLDLLRDKTDRTAAYSTAYAVYLPGVSELQVIKEHTRGIILAAPRLGSYIEGVPFRSLFYIPELSMMFYEARELPDNQRMAVRMGHEIALRKCREVILGQKKIFDI